MAMQKANRKSSWASVFNIAFTQDAEQLGKREIYKEAKKAGADETTAKLFGRLEALNLASTAQFAHDAQQSTIQVALQLQNALNDRTSYLAREIGRLWQAQGQGGVGTALWNFAAGTALGQNFGLKPIVPPPAPIAPFNPIPQGSSDPHADTAHPPTVAISAQLLSLGYVLVGIDETVTNCDKTGAVVIKNTSGGALTMSPGMDLVVLTYHTPYAERPFVTAYAEADASNTHAGIIGYCSPKGGGAADTCTLQALEGSGSTIANNGTITIRYFVQDTASS